jgi:hypothetical protein
MADKTVRDNQGNRLMPEQVVYAQIPWPVIWKVAAVEEGGLMTPQGLTPATVRLYSDITLRQAPGIPFVMLLRIVQPSEQELLERVASQMHRG